MTDTELVDAILRELPVGNLSTHNRETIVERVRQGVRTVHELTGLRPTKIVLGRTAYDALLNADLQFGDDDTARDVLRRPLRGH